MIARISGTVLETTVNQAVIDVHGVGYLVALTGASLAKLIENQEVSLFTYLVVREDALDLYGFIEKAERDCFNLLLSVSGIGPKSALGILDKVDHGRLKHALAQGDLVYLTKMAGIGNKTAQKLILELRDKIGPLEYVSNDTDSDALEALAVLGYNLDEARAVLKSVPDEIQGTEKRVRAALRMLGRK
jgi:holliday junction DNA helicase RuvA